MLSSEDRRLTKMSKTCMDQKDFLPENSRISLSKIEKTSIK